MKRFLALLALTSLLLAACGGTPVPNDDAAGRASVAATQTAGSIKTPTLTRTAASTETPEPTDTPTPLPVGTWETVIDGMIYDKSTGPGRPIAGASISYNVVHSYFPELQKGRPNKTVTDIRGEFFLPVIVHDTDNIRILVEAQGFIPYEETLVGVDLFGGGSFDIGLTPLGTATVSPP